MLGVGVLGILLDAACAAVAADDVLDDRADDAESAVTNRYCGNVMHAYVRSSEHHILFIYMK